MSKDLTPHGPEHFGLSTFAELLSSRTPILGEEPGSFEQFREGLMLSLIPFTPYECVVAENLVAIEWELFQQRRMRDTALRKALRQSVYDAVMSLEEYHHDKALDAEWQRFIAAGGDEDEWVDPFEFDKAAAEEKADDLAERATSQEPDVQATALNDLVEMGISPVDHMSKAYGMTYGDAPRHDAKVQELERRRREVRRDFDALQKARPIDAGVEDAEVVED